MTERRQGLIGGIAAERPILAASVFSFGAAALAAVGYREATLSYSSASIAFLAALFIMVVAPASVAAIAPRNFWLRFIFASFAAGLFLAVRRVVIQSELTFGPFDVGLALLFAAAGVFILAAAAPLWRFAIGGSQIGLAAVILGTAGALSVVAIETRSGEVETAGAALALAAGLGAALSVQIAAAFARNFAEGGDNVSAAAAAARDTSASAIFGLAVGVAGVAAMQANAGVSAEIMLSGVRVAAAAIGFCVAAPLFLLAGALSLKSKTEATAVKENRRRSALRPFLAFASATLPPSSALAATAILIIGGVVAAFETTTPPGLGEIGVAAATALFAGIAFVSLRTALMTTILLVVAGRIVAWIIEAAAPTAPTDVARTVACVVAAALYLQIFIAWRDRRHMRRKAREVVSMTIADSLFPTIAASVLAVAALGASEAAGVWSEGVEAALYAGGLALVGLVAAPPLMTATSALFGRN